MSMLSAASQRGARGTRAAKAQGGAQVMMTAGDIRARRDQLKPLRARARNLRMTIQSEQAKYAGWYRLHGWTERAVQIPTVADEPDPEPTHPAGRREDDEPRIDLSGSRHTRGDDRPIRGAGTGAQTLALLHATDHTTQERGHICGHAHADARYSPWRRTPSEGELHLHRAAAVAGGEPESSVLCRTWSPPQPDFRNVLEGSGTCCSLRSPG